MHAVENITDKSMGKRQSKPLCQDGKKILTRITGDQS
jgi:hypothetical protein